MNVTPEQCRALTSHIKTYAEQLDRYAWGAARTEHNRDLRDRGICYKLYRDLAIRDAAALLLALHVGRSDLDKLPIQARSRLESAVKGLLS